MIPEGEQYLASLRAIHAGFERAIAGLDSAALDFVPVAGANSLAAIVTHAMGAERNLITRSVAGQEIQRDRAAELAVLGKTEAELAALIRSTERETEAVISQVSAAQMDELREHSGGPRPVRWFILHAVDHAAEHLGHAGLTRQLLDSSRAI